MKQVFVRKQLFFRAKYGIKVHGHPSGPATTDQKGLSWPGSSHILHNLQVSVHDAMYTIPTSYAKVGGYGTSVPKPEFEDAGSRSVYQLHGTKVPSPGRFYQSWYGKSMVVLSMVPSVLFGAVLIFNGPVFSSSRHCWGLSAYSTAQSFQGPVVGEATGARPTACGTPRADVR